MNLQEYLTQSSGWLVDTSVVFDLAEAAQRACTQTWTPPTTPEEGPYFTSMRSQAHFKAALPLGIKTSKESQQAAYVAMGDLPKLHTAAGVKVPLLNGNHPRVEGILARAGIIAQFELWKTFVKQFPGYPFNRKQADKYVFAHDQEKSLLLALIDDRNALTHEIESENDPSMRRLVNYAWECQHVARWVTQIYQTEDPVNGSPPQLAKRMTFPTE